MATITKENGKFIVRDVCGDLMAIEDTLVDAIVIVAELVRRDREHLARFHAAWNAPR